MQPWLKLSLAVLTSVALTACGGNSPIAADRYLESDKLFDALAANVASEPSLEKVLEIDHSRTGAEVESYMPPSRVLVFSNKQLETELLKENRLVAIDLPLRVLAYEEAPNGPSRIVWNSLEYLSSRYGLSPSEATDSLFENTMSVVVKGIDPVDIAAFSENRMQPDGIITLDSPFDFESTHSRILEAIGSQDDTVLFDSVDFQARAQALGVNIPPTTLIMFGAPGPGAKAMRNANTLGLDAFCQKFLVWEDDAGMVHLSFSDLFQIAERQAVSKSLPLRVIRFRLKRTFSKALRADDA